jgi:activator of Hsp90 ATPase-like protein
MMTQVEPIRRSITVRATPELAFELFTARIGSWWPVETHSRAVDQFDGVTVDRVEFEPRVGGHVLEHLSNGATLPWGEVIRWTPPSGFVLAWKPNSNANPPTELEVRFTPEADGTLVELEHRRWERLGPIAVEARDSYGDGWITTLERFRDAVEEEVS